MKDKLRRPLPHGLLEYSNLNIDFSEIVSETLSYCYKNIEFYRSQWRTTVNVSDFGDLPLIDKSILRANHQQFVNPSLSTGALMHTSGTTGDPLLVPRSTREIAYTNELLRSLRHQQGEVPRPLGLLIRDNVHGIGPNYQSATMWVGDPSFTPPTLELGLQYLQRRFALPGCEERITSIFMSLLELLHFTEYAKQRGLIPSETHLRTVYSTGFPLPSQWDRKVRDYWGCRHCSVFSLTEVFGQALSCSECGDYHWDPFTLVEFLNPNDGTPVDTGMALLVVTTLYPIVQMMPLIRYRTGDLVCVRRDCYRGPGFKPIGRLETAVSIDGKSAVSFDQDLLEVLADVPWIKRSKPFVLTKLGIAGTQTFGMPTVAVRIESDEILVTLLTETDAGVSTCSLEGVARQIEGVVRRALDRSSTSQPDIKIRVTAANNECEGTYLFGCPTAGIPTQ